MSVQAFVKITGTKQGQFKAPNAKSPAGAGGIPVLRFDSLASAPRDVATGQASGRRQWQPIRLTKEWDAASPQLLAALTTNEVLPTVVFEFYRSDPTGKLALHYRISLKNATVAAMDSQLDLTGPASGGTRPELEVVELTFQSITVENVDGKTSATDIGATIAPPAQPVPLPQQPGILRDPIARPVIPQ